MLDPNIEICFDFFLTFCIIITIIIILFCFAFIVNTSCKYLALYMLSQMHRPRNVSIAASEPTVF